jgi:hypothetical protein
VKITMIVTLPADNEIQFFDVCKAAAEKLTELAQQAIDAGDHEPFRGTTHDVVVDVSGDEPETVGQIKVSR